MLHETVGAGVQGGVHNTSSTMVLEVSKENGNS
jgi:hypothetical protein